MLLNEAAKKEAPAADSVPSRIQALFNGQYRVFPLTCTSDVFFLSHHQKVFRRQASVHAGYLCAVEGRSHFFYYIKAF